MTQALAPVRDRRSAAAAPARDDRLTFVDGFLRPDQCAAILHELEFAYWSRSKVYVEMGDGDYQHILGDKRDSMTTSERWFTTPLRRAIGGIDRRLARRLPQVLTHREEWQATRDRRGGRFGYHADSGYFAGEPAGERTHTVLIYLEAPRRGGVTRFPHLGIDVKSVAGRLAIWTNLTADGRGDPEMNPRRHARFRLPENHSRDLDPAAGVFKSKLERKTMTREQKSLVNKIAKKYGPVLDLKANPEVMIEILRQFGPIFDSPDGGSKPGGVGSPPPCIVESERALLDDMMAAMLKLTREVAAIKKAVTSQTK